MPAWYDVMKRKKFGKMAQNEWILFALCALVTISVVDGARIHWGTRRHGQHHDGQADHPLFHMEGVQQNGDHGNAHVVVKEMGFKQRRLMAETTETPESDSKSFWEEVEEFYSDNNNMAMYCVLPLIVLVYGGCSAIYCCYKCRRMLKRRKHKRLHNEDDSSVAGDERNDLNQLDDNGGQSVKTVSGNNAAFSDAFNVQNKGKSPLPWDHPSTPPAIAAAINGQLKRQDSFQDNTTRSHEAYSSGSRDSSSLQLERERDKLEQRIEVQPSPRFHDNSEENGRTPKPPVAPVTKAADFSRFQAPRPIEIVPISQTEYQRHMQDQGLQWDPLHNRPYASRNSSRGESDSKEERRSGRETSYSIRDEIMAKYDALTSLAMAKKTADILRTNGGNMDHRPDTLKRKAGKKGKLIFIAE